MKIFNWYILIFSCFLIFMMQAFSWEYVKNIAYEDPLNAVYHYFNKDSIAAQKRISELEDIVSEKKNTFNENIIVLPDSKEKISAIANYIHEIEILREKIKTEQIIIEKEEARKQWIKQLLMVAGIVGTGSLILYKLFSPHMSEVKHLPNVHSAVTISKEKVTQDENKIKDNTSLPKETDLFSSNEKMPLTEKEKELYVLRYKNLKGFSEVSLLSFLFGVWLTGPLALPIEATLLTIPILSGLGSAYYKQQLNSENDISDNKLSLTDTLKNILKIYNSKN